MQLGLLNGASARKPVMNNEEGCAEREKGFCPKCESAACGRRSGTKFASVRWEKYK
jgi:hypothetical protein